MQLFSSTKLLNLTTTEPTKQPYIAENGTGNGSRGKSISTDDLSAVLLLSPCCGWGI